MARIALLLLGGFCLFTLSGCTTLFQAATLNDVSKVQSMLDRGTDVDSRDVATDRTPLMAAALGGHTELVKLLIEKGANVNHADKDGFTPLTLAIAGGHTELVKLLVEQGANVNCLTKVDETPLMRAALGGKIEIVTFLFEKGGSVKHVSANGATPLTAAAKYGHLEVVKFLYEKGASVNAAKKDGNTPLIFAAMGDKPALVKYLIEKGADPNQANNVGAPPIPQSYFSYAGLTEPVRLLWENQNIETNNGSTPLIFAASRGFTETARILIDHGADPSVRGKDGKTALDWAKKRKHVEICKALEAKETAKKLEILTSKDPAVLRAYLDAHPEALSSITNPELRLRYTGPAELRITDVVHLVKVGTRDALIIAKINSTGGPYKNFSVSEMSALKKMDISDDVVAAMIEVTTAYNKEQKVFAEQKRNQTSQAPVQVAQQVQQPTQAPESNTLSDCLKLAAALKSCDMAGGLLSAGCKAVARSQYNCPNL